MTDPKRIDPDKAREYIADVTAPSDLYSNCCGAMMYQFGDTFMCKGCREYCEAN